MRKTLSVAIITRNEEANLGRTLGSVAWADEIVVVDSGSDDRTEEIARSFRSRFFLEEWKGFAAQKNSALEKCSCDWVLSLDADEVLSDELAKEIWELLENDPPFDGYALPRRNLFLGRWMRFRGFYPDPKLRLFRRGAASFEARPVHKRFTSLARRAGSRGTWCTMPIHPWLLISRIWTAIARWGRSRR